MTVLAFLPVSLFLLALIYLDSFKLVRPRVLIELIVIGCLAAAAGLLINYWLLRLGVSRYMLTRYDAPAVEEILKAIPIIVMLRDRQIGFLIDAAICGFAVGTGFALAENLYFVSSLAAAPPALWIVRGFGTAIMHGGTTAIMAMMMKALWPRLAPAGIIVAFALHSLFNHFVLSPAMSTLVIILVLPPLMVLVFAQSERHVRQWLGTGFDLDAELLKAMSSGEFAESGAGQYLQSLREHFDGAVLADMLCYLRLQSELSLRVKGVLMLRESGFPVKKDGEVKEKLSELRYLRGTMGKTGELALAPLLRDIWPHLLE
ncbi:MAG TPA: PrsW family glutamic-type intramembrane protease [Thermoanaerobaculia bacterium]